MRYVFKHIITGVIFSCGGKKAKELLNDKSYFLINQYKRGA